MRYPSFFKQKTVLPCKIMLISPPTKGIGLLIQPMGVPMDFMSKGMQQRSRRSILPAALTRDRPPEQASRLGHRPTF